MTKDILNDVPPSASEPDHAESLSRSEALALAASILGTKPKALLLTPIEAAAILGVVPKTLAVWRSTKRYPLPYIRIGGRVRYRLGDVEAFIESRRQQR